MKEQEKILGKATNEAEINNLPDKGFEALIIRLLTELGKRIQENSENFNKELENIFKNPVRTEDYNSGNEKHTRKNEQQTR